MLFRNELLLARASSELTASGPPMAPLKCAVRLAESFIGGGLAASSELAGSGLALPSMEAHDSVSCGCVRQRGGAMFCD